jgi:hypothetical protein
MFRRNKKAKKIDDDDSVIPLTGPDTLSSSSSAEISKAKGGGKGGRMLGMGKKKNAIVNDKSGNASGDKKSQTVGENGTTIIKPAQAPVIMQQTGVPESKSVSHKGKQMSSKVPTDSSALSPPQPAATQQRISSQTTASTKSIETRETNDVNSRSSSINPINPPLESKLSSNNNEKTVTAVSKKALLTGSATSSFTPATANPPALIVNGGGEQQSNVPLARSGWSVQSNGSSAMNSESYIKSLDNVPPLRSGKVSLFVTISLFCTTDKLVETDGLIIDVFNARLTLC